MADILDTLRLLFAGSPDGSAPPVVDVGAQALAPGQAGSSAPLQVTPPDSGVQLPPDSAPMRSESTEAARAARSPASSAAAPTGNVLARLRTPQSSASGRPGALGRLGIGLSGAGDVKAGVGPWTAFAQGFGGAVKANRSADAAAAKDARETRRQDQSDAIERIKLALLGRTADRADADSASNRTVNERRVAAYEKQGGGKPQSAVDALWKTDQILKNFRSNERQRLGLDADDEALPSQKLPKDERAKREKELEGNVTRRQKELEGNIPNLQPAPAATPAALSAPAAAAPQADKGTWTRVRRKSDGALMEYNPATKEMRQFNAAPAAPEGDEADDDAPAAPPAPGRASSSEPRPDAGISGPVQNGESGLPLFTGDAGPSILDFLSQFA